MADKFLGIGGRNADGNAKALRLDDIGNIGISQRAFRYSDTDYIVRGARGYTLYAVDSTGQIKRSLDLGSTWVDTDIPTTTRPDTVAVAICTSGVFIIVYGKGYFAANGVNFTQTLDGFLSPLAGGIAYDGDAIVFGEYDQVGTKRGLWHSANAGQTWAKVFDGDINIRHFHSVDKIGSVWIATSGDNDAQVRWYQSNNGTTWTIINNTGGDQAYRTLGVVATVNGVSSGIPGTRLMWAGDSGGQLGVFSAEVGAEPYIRRHISLPNRAYAVEGSGAEVLIGVVAEDRNVGSLGRLYVTKDCGETFQEDMTWKVAQDKTGGVHAIIGPDFDGNYYLTLKDIHGKSTYAGCKATPTGLYGGNIKSISKQRGLYARTILFSNHEIRDTVRVNSNVAVIRGSRFKSIAVINSHDVAITISIRGTATTGVPTLSKTLGTFSVPAGGNVVVDSADHPALAHPYEKILLWATAASEPSSGNISAWVVNPIDEV